MAHSVKVTTWFGPGYRLPWPAYDFKQGKDIAILHDRSCRLEWVIWPGLKR